VIGVDMTVAQLRKARDLAAGWGVDFHEGYIEQPPVQHGSVDCVISNGVMNLARDKHAVLRRCRPGAGPGGRLEIGVLRWIARLPAISTVC
jgi:SAM-dependent methyltransferase